MMPAFGGESRHDGFRHPSLRCDDRFSEVTIRRGDQQEALEKNRCPTSDKMEEVK